MSLVPRRSCLLVVIVAAVVAIAFVALLAFWAYREYGPLPIREAPTKIRFTFPDTVETVAFSPDGRHVAAGGKSGVKVWDRASGQTVWEKSQDIVIGVCYSPDGSRLAVLSKNGRLNILEAGTGKFQLNCQPGENDPAAAFIKPDTDTSTRSASCVCYSADGRWLATGHYYGSYPHGIAGDVRVWDATTGGLVRKVVTPAGVTAVAFSPNSQLLATGDAAGGLLLWDPANGRKVRDLLPRGWLHGVAFRSNTRDVVYAGGWSGEDNPATVWDHRAEAVRPLAGGRAFIGVYVRCLTVSPDGRKLAMGELVKDYRRGGQRVRVWNLETGDLLADYDCPATVSSLAYSPDGRELAVGCGNDVLIWEAP